MKRHAVIAAIACLACALPAFGQDDLRDRLVAPLHEACVADVQGALAHALKARFATPIDSAKFCGCADAGIRQDRVLDDLARRPGSTRRAGSFEAGRLEARYFFDGLACYSRLEDWAHPAATDRTSRSPEEIVLVLEMQKGAIWAAYDRALKSNPALSGKVVFEFVVEPDGRTSRVTVLSSGLQDEKLLGELQIRLQSMAFPAEPVATLVATYPMDFLPH